MGIERQDTDFDKTFANYKYNKRNMQNISSRLYLDSSRVYKKFLKLNSKKPKQFNYEMGKRHQENAN